MRISNYPTDTITGSEMILASNYDTETQKYATVNFTVDTLKTFLVGTDDTNEFTNITLGGSLKFEGTANAYETTLGAVDPTADATLNLPAMAAGTYHIPVLAAASTTAITSTPEELNLLDNVSGLVQADFTKLAAVDATAAELNLLDGSIANTVVNSKAVIYGSAGQITGTFTGNITGNVTGDVTGNLTGNVTGNASGTALTVTQAAQTAITSLGTLTALTVDNIVIDGAVIGHTSDTDLITLADGALTVTGTIASGAITSTAGIAGTTGTFTGNIDITKAGNAVLTVKATELASAARLKLKSASNDSGYISFDDNDDTILAQIKSHGSDAGGANVPLRKGLVFNTNGTTTALTIDSSQAATFAGTVKATQFKQAALDTEPGASSTGTVGDIKISDTHIYVCTAANTWKRAALTGGY
jgi:cytoskeletal protein CcmA (bactofilin family)